MKHPQNPVQITQNHIDALKAAKADTGCGESMFLKWAENVPRGLNSTTIYQWMSGQAQEANKEQLEFTLEHWPNMPRRIVITAELAAKLESEHKRTGLGATRLLRTMASVPNGLKAIMVTQWKTSAVAKAREDHVEAVLNAYAEINSDR